MKVSARYWLMKSEPRSNADDRLPRGKPDEGYLSIDDLKKLKKSPWTGVRGYQARNYMRDEMQKGDMVIFYHSSSKEVGPAGVAKVCSLPYPDFSQFNPQSKYFDAKSKKEKPTWVMVDVQFVKKFPNIVSREEMKKTKALEKMALWKYMRLSITPLTKNEFHTILKLAEK